MTNSAFSASERRHLEEPERCEQHGAPTDAWGYCGICDDEAYDYRNGDNP